MSPTASPAEATSGQGAPGDRLTPAIEIEGLRKQYGRTLALPGLDLTVQPGEVFGFLGPNGAGKTTTIKILTGLVKPTAGTARIFGRSVGDRVARRRVGYLPENFRFQDWLSGAELLDFHGRLAGLSAAERRTRVPAVLARVGLADRGNDRIRGYSKGMTQRIGLGQAIIHRPDLILLDEPTSALDPVGRRDVRDLIRSLRAEGATVFLNSHLLSEIEMVCDRVAIVDQGRLVRSGRLGDLIAGAPELQLILDRVDGELRTLLAHHGEVLEADATTLILSVSELEMAPAVAEAVVRAGYRLYGLVPRQQTLEDVFVGLVDGGAS